MIDELYKQGRPLPRVISNESLKHEMDLVNQIRMKQRAEAEKTGLNPPGGISAAEEQKFADPRQVEILSSKTIQTINELTESGWPLPEVISNASIAQEKEIFTKLMYPETPSPGQTQSMPGT